MVVGTPGYRTNYSSRASIVMLFDRSLLARSTSAGTDGGSPGTRNYATAISFEASSRCAEKMLDRSLLSRIGNTDKSPFTISTVSSLVFGSRSVVVAEMGTEHVDSGISYSTLLVLPGPLDLSFCAGSATYTGLSSGHAPSGVEPHQTSTSSILVLVSIYGVF